MSQCAGYLKFKVLTILIPSMIKLALLSGVFQEQGPSPHVHTASEGKGEKGKYETQSTRGPRYKTPAPPGFAHLGEIAKELCPERRHSGASGKGEKGRGKEK